MKTKYLFHLILTSLIALCQPVSAQQTKLSYHLAKLSNNEAQQSKVISILVKGNVDAIKEETSQSGGIFKYAAGNICSVNIPVWALKKLEKNNQIQRVEEGHIKVETMNDKMLINNKVDLVHQGVSPLPQGYNGAGTIIGVIDTGMDFTHPDFKDSLGQSRVLWIWDHLLPNASNTPQPYNYGQEFSKADMDAGNANAHIDGTAHGTHVAGIATSNGNSRVEYTGAAPKADIIAVSLDFNQDNDSWLSTIADAVEYIFAKADAAGKPCVINISAGTYYGSHDGKDLQALAMDYLVSAAPARSIVASAGNAGSVPFHLQHNPTIGDTTFTWFKNTSAPIYIEFWADSAQLNNVRFSIGADKTTAGFQDRGSLAWTNITPKLGILGVDTLWSFSGNRLAIIQTYGQLIDTRYSMIYYVLPDSVNYNFRLMTTGNGKLDCWSFDMINSGLPAVSAYPKIVNYVLPDLQQTLCSSFQCSDKVITVGQYVNRNSYVDVNGVLQTFPTTEGALATSSSHGPTRIGMIKPDITSTGEVTLSALRLSSVAWFLANQPYKLASDSIHIRDGGTSSAAPVISGIGALYFQRYPTATWSDFKTKVLYCAVQDNFTGSILPNNSWGHGKVDALAVVSGVGCTIASVNEIQEKTIEVYPNPTSSKCTIVVPESFNNYTIELFSIVGEKVKTLKGMNQRKVEISRDNLAQGIYLIRIQSEQKSLQSKILFE